MVRALLLFFFMFSIPSYGKVKFIIEDFEGCSRNPNDLRVRGIFSFGSISLKTSMSKCLGKGYTGRVAVEQYPGEASNFGGWGIGVERYIDLDQQLDRFNFLYLNKEQTESTITIFLHDDDNYDNTFSEQADDRWKYVVTLKPGDHWNISSISLSDFVDDTKGGDNTFNIGFKTGKFLSVIFRTESGKVSPVLFDFLNFSKGDFHVVNPDSIYSSGCAIGAWSEEGARNSMFDIADGFVRCTKSDPNISVLHTYLSFSDDGGTIANKFPNVRDLNDVVNSGLVPMITIENQFLDLKPKRQPSLKAIADGKFDGYFYECGKRLRQVNGKVLVRLMHEFNGNWYPWCLATNGNNSEIYKTAYRRIVKLMRDVQANNVQFVWCVNSISIPQAPWNNIIDAYPGDDVVDIVGTDIYNGAEKGGNVWRSFRKEAAETYFVLTENFASKPIMICEFSSREKLRSEGPDAPTKAIWIKEASEAMKTDYSKFFVAAWFNAGKYKVNTSEESRQAFVNYLTKDMYFRFPKKVLKEKLK